MKHIKETNIIVTYSELNKLRTLVFNYTGGQINVTGLNVSEKDTYYKYKLSLESNKKITTLNEKHVYTYMIGVMDCLKSL